MKSNTDQYIQRLTEVINPLTGQPLNDQVTACVCDGDRLALEFTQGYPDKAVTKKQIADALNDLISTDRINFTGHIRIRSHAVQEKLQPLGNIKNIIAVGSGKGGVGKSTVSVNLALALQQAGASVGILDADIYGPSQPTMLGVSGQPRVTADKKMLPHQAHGIQIMSIGFLVAEDNAMIWRGPMVSQALQQLLQETNWEPMDYLIIDLPPGTGDIQLTLLQKIPVAASVVVTTPQNVALMDAAKAIQMFAKLEVPVLGIVENMSAHVCSACGHSETIFGSDGGEQLAAKSDVPLLGQIPLQASIREHCDMGVPTVVAEPDTPIGQCYKTIAMHVAGQLSIRSISKRLAGLSVNLQ